MTFEILVATMGQSDFSKINEMNIRSNVLFANQADETSYKEQEFNGKCARMITTTTRGVGVNRNLLLLYSQGDILLMADDDMVYDDQLEENVIKAFKDFPNADVIAFGSYFLKDGKIISSIKNSNSKLPIYKAMKYGTCLLAFRRSSVIKSNMTFTTLFGGGTLYGHGEDSDFILQCYRNRLKVYKYDYMLATIATDVSTWFTGYGEKYFYDAGAFAKHSFGFFAKPYMLYIATRLNGRTQMPFYERWRILNEGYKNLAKLIPYSEWKNEQV